MKPSVYIRDMKNLEKEANKLLKDLNNGKVKIIKEQVNIVKKEIRAAAPQGPTGNLKKAVYSNVLPPNVERRRAVGFAGIRPRKAPHAHLVEYGHGGPHPAKPHPFFWKAIEKVADKVTENISTGLKKIIEG
ncbi:MAG: hypothetical protein PHQ43_12745 [Dehalococcoidales bacterium]|jgi:HK97 gp10 family phage protein|nr:hypothetical protein [Dehalococcoidales bacterium]